MAETASASILNFNDAQGGLWLGPHFEIFQNDQAQGEDFFGEVPGGFQINKHVPSFGYTDKKYWARIRINNPTNESQAAVFIFKGPFESITIFQKTPEGSISSRSLGMFRPSIGGMGYRYPAFPVTLASGINTLVFTQDAVAPHFPVLLQSPEDFERTKYREHFFISFLYGISLVVLLFAIFSVIEQAKTSIIYFTISLIMHLLFSLFVTGSARVFTLFMRENMGLDIYWLEQFIYRNWIFWWGASGFFSIMFAWHFLELRNSLSRTIRYVIYTGLFSNFCLATLSYIDPVLSINAFSPLYHLIILFFAYQSFVKYRAGFIPAANYTIAWFLYVVSISVQAMYFFGLIGPSFLTSWGLLIGLLLQYFFFGLAIIKKRRYVETILESQKQEEQKKVLAAKEQLEINFAKLKKFDEALRVFVSPTIQLEVALGKNPLDYEARSVTRIVTFTDMRNYTRFAEKLDLSSSHSLLNSCFKHIMDPVFEFQGEVDKLIGDAVMSVFKEKSALNCLHSVLKGRENLSRQNKDLVARGLMPVKFGTGISIGNVLSGNFGTMQKLDRTVLGDAVNIAARIESETKNYGVDVLASEDFIAQIPDFSYCRPIDDIVLRGKDLPITIYEVFGHNTHQIIEFKMSTIGPLQEFLELKRAGRLADCVKILEDCIKRCPPHTYKANTIMDPTLKTLLDNILNLIKYKAG